MAELIFSEGTRLPDGRKVRILSYDDGSARFRLDDPPYFLEEAFLAGGSSRHAIIKLTPRVVRAGEIEHEEDGNPLLKLKAGIENLRQQADAAPVPQGRGAYKHREFIKGLESGLLVARMWIDQLLEAKEEEKAEVPARRSDGVDFEVDDGNEQ